MPYCFSLEAFIYFPQIFFKSPLWTRLSCDLTPICLTTKDPSKNQCHAEIHVYFMHSIRQSVK